MENTWDPQRSKECYENLMIDILEAVFVRSDELPPWTKVKLGRTRNITFPYFTDVADRKTLFKKILSDGEITECDPICFRMFALLGVFFKHLGLGMCVESVDTLRVLEKAEFMFEPAPNMDSTELELAIEKLLDKRWIGLAVRILSKFGSTGILSMFDAKPKALLVFGEAIRCLANNTGRQDLLLSVPKMICSKSALKLVKDLPWQPAKKTDSSNPLEWWQRFSNVSLPSHHIYQSSSGKRDTRYILRSRTHIPKVEPPHDIRPSTSYQEISTSVSTSKKSTPRPSTSYRETKPETKNDDDNDDQAHVKRILEFYSEQSQDKIAGHGQLYKRSLALMDAKNLYKKIFATHSPVASCSSSSSRGTEIQSGNEPCSSTTHRKKHSHSTSSVKSSHKSSSGKKSKGSSTTTDDQNWNRRNLCSYLCGSSPPFGTLEYHLRGWLMNQKWPIVREFLNHSHYSHSLINIIPTSFFLERPPEKMDPLEPEETIDLKMFRKPPKITPLTSKLEILGNKLSEEDLDQCEDPDSICFSGREVVRDGRISGIKCTNKTCVKYRDEIENLRSLVKNDEHFFSTVNIFLAIDKGPLDSRLVFVDMQDKPEDIISEVKKKLKKLISKKKCAFIVDKTKSHPYRIAAFIIGENDPDDAFDLLEEFYEQTNLLK